MKGHHRRCRFVQGSEKLTPETSNCRLRAFRSSAARWRGGDESRKPKGTPSKTYGAKHEVPKQTWSTLKMVFDGSRFEVSFDGGRITVEDKTFTGAGKTGFWKTLTTSHRSTISGLKKKN